MAKGGRKRSRDKVVRAVAQIAASVATKTTKAEYFRPTPERLAKNPDRAAGMARRIKPVIELLLASKQITQAEYDALAYYRDQASLADKSPVRSCVDFSPRGGHGPGNAIISAQRETWRMDRDLGDLQPIARAIAVNDLSLTQWCIEKHGGREHIKGGVVVAVIPRGENNGAKKIETARMELRMAAHRVTQAP